MNAFLTTLRQKNSLLFWFGVYNFFVALICILLMQIDERSILGVNAWLKPMKFYLAVGVMVWTMGWILQYLQSTSKIRRYSVWIAFTMFFENALIFMQAARGTTSHYNSSSTTNSIIFSLMGMLIVAFTIVCIFITFQFFRQKEFTISASYVWGIRLGLLFFIIFSLEGGMMLSIMRHTVGAPDGGAGLPVTNWSKEHGDLRISHFLGIHSLQVLPLAGNFIFKKPGALISFGILYAVVVIAILVIALNGAPLIR